MSGRRERERERHRQEILAAASALLAERGPDGLTMDEVARRAEFAVGSLYRHFRSKDELVVGVVAHSLSAFGAEVEGITESDGPFETRFDAFLAAYVRTVQEQRPIWRLLLLLRNDGGSPEIGATVEVILNWFDRLSGLIERGQADGVIDPALDPALVVVAVHGMLEQFAKRAVLGLEVDFAAASRLVRRAVLVGFAAPGEGS